MTTPPHLNATPVVVRQSRLKILGYVLLAATFLVVAGFMTQDKNLSLRATIGMWLGFLFFGPLILLFVYQLIRPDHLVLTTEGLTHHALRGTKSWRWEEIGELYIFRIRGSKHVAFSFAQRPAQPTLIQRANAAVGADASLGTSWSMPAEQMVTLLNQALTRWRRTA